MNFANMLISELVGAENTEVVVSKVDVPACVTLPSHFHPGEEFAYVLDGSFTLWQEGEEAVSFQKGEVGVVPYKKVHTISTGEKGASILIFRVHEKGQPERVLVEAELVA